MGGVAELLSGSWVASGGVLGGPAEVLGVMLAPKMEAKSGKYQKNYGSKRQAVLEWFFDGFCVEARQTPKSVFELRNPIVKCISASSTQTQEFVRVGWQHGPMLAFKILEDYSPGSVRASPGRS